MGATILERLYWTAYTILRTRSQGRYAFKPLAAIRRDQTRRLRTMVAHAYRRVPYYGETMDRLGLAPADIRTVEDLARLPVIEREQLQRDPEYFVATGTRLDRCLCCPSSGSSGAPVFVYYDAQALFRTTVHAGRTIAIAKAFMGKPHGCRLTMITSAASNGLQMLDFCKAHSLLYRGIPTAVQVLDVAAPVQEHAARMDEFKPDLIATYGSYLEILFPYLHTAGHRHHLPTVVAYGGDFPSDAVRRLIIDEFKILLLSNYQAVEANRIGFECEQHRGLHLNIDLHPVRIVDAEGRTVPQGQPGDVVVSNLVNRVTVLLNYRLGDIATLLPDPCPCGRLLPLLSLPQGRCYDFLVLPSGQLLNALALRGLFFGGDPIWQYQLVQQSLTHLRLALVVGEACDRADLSKRLAKGFANTFGEEVTLDIEFVASFERPASGKHRAVRSMLPQAQRRPPEGAPTAEEHKP